MGGPVFAGAAQLTIRLVGVAGISVGAIGLSGGSSTSVTLIVKGCVPVRARSPVPLVADTKTMYALLREAVVGRS